MTSHVGFPKMAKGIIESRVWCLIFFYILPTLNATVIYTQTKWQSAVRIYNYKAYSSTQILEYKIPPQAIRSSWVLTSTRDPANRCEERTAVMVLQHGSYPILSPLNETFPDRYNLHRTNLQVIKLKSDNSSNMFYIQNPLPGSWFAAAFLGDYVDDRITQKGLTVECRYYIGATQYIEALDHVQDIVMEVSIPLQAKEGYRNLFRFHTTEHTWQYDIEIHNCTYVLDPQQNETSSETPLNYCPMRLTSRSLAIPIWDTEPSHTENCNSSSIDDCRLSVFSPATDAWQYVMFEPLIKGNVSFVVFVGSQECGRFSTPQPVNPPADKQIPPESMSNETFPNSNITTQNGTGLQYAMHIAQLQGLGDLSKANITISGAEQSYPDGNSTENVPIVPNVGNCVRIPQMGRYAVSNRAFQTRYQLRVNILPVPNKITVPDYEPLVMKIDVETVFDTGGTMRYQIELDDESYNDTLSQIVSVQTCITKWGVPADDRGVRCHPDNYMVVNNTHQTQEELYFPYPEPGSWYISLLAQCYRNNSENGSLVLESCLLETVANFGLEVTPCHNGGCGDYGSCREYYSGVLHFSSCRCVANYRGYACSDASEADTDTEQLVATLLLTLSNLLFIPAIVVATYRRYYTEAVVYFYTMFFSTFYHACDGDRKYLYCMMPYGVLAHCDFFGSILAFWVTLMAMSKLTYKMKSFFYILASLGLAIGVTWDRHSLWTFLVPTATGIIIMIISWSIKCHQRQTCYPSKVRWLGFMLPGLLIAGAGLITFGFFETERNYKYTHSVWHACMALCLVFILPSRPSRKTVSPSRVRRKTSDGNGVDLIRCNNKNSDVTRGTDEVAFTADLEKNYLETNGQAMYLGDRIYV